MTSSEPLAEITLAPRKEIFAWAMFDFANSGYTTVVSTAIFNAYFVDVIAGGAGFDKSGLGTLLWTLTVAISNGLIVVTAPILGAIADYSGAKKKLLFISTACCVAGTAALALMGPGMVVPAMAVVIFANFMYGTGEDLIAAFLPEIAPQNEMGRVSAFGWTIGYLGGLLVMAACLGYVSWAQHLGHGETQFVPVTMLIVATVFAMAATPTFLWLRERAPSQALPTGENYVRIGFQRLKETLEHATHFQDLFRFLICLFVFSCGTTTVINLAAVYAENVMGFKMNETLTMVIVVNLTAAAGAFVFGHIQDRFGSVKTLALTLLLWIAATALAAATTERAFFWVAALMMGTAMGSSQSAARALVGQFSPPQRSAEFFGLWGLTVKLATIAGPMTYGLLSFLSAGNQRLAILSTVCFFAVGIAVLLTVNEARGRIAAIRKAQEAS